MSTLPPCRRLKSDGLAVFISQPYLLDGEHRMATTLPAGQSTRFFSLPLDVTNKAGDFLFYFLVALSIVPVWTSSYIPTQDGPVHLANANIIRSLLFDEGGYFAGYYHLTQGSLTNWAIYIIINLINFFVDIQYAEKVVISLYLMLLPLSVRFALLSIDRRNLHLQFLILPMLYNVTLSYGFYNFVLSLPLFFFGVGYWYKHRDKRSTVNITLLSVLLLISYLAHPLTLIFFAATIFSSSFYETLLHSHKHSWNFRTTLQQLASSLAPLALSILPCVVLFLLFLSSEGTSSTYTTGPYARFYALTRLNTLVPYGPTGAFVSKLFSLTIAIIFIAAIFHQARAALHNIFTLPLIISILLYFIFPDEISNGSVINCRLQLFTVFSLILFFANQSFSQTIKLFTVASCIVLFISSLWFVRLEYAKLNNTIATVMQAANHITTNSNIISLSSTRTLKRAPQTHFYTSHLIFPGNEMPLTSATFRLRKRIFLSTTAFQVYIKTNPTMSNASPRNLTFLSIRSHQISTSTIYC